jgi:diaminopimelate decarboxylase
VNLCTDIVKLKKLINNQTPFFVWDTELLQSRIRYVYDNFSCIPRFRLFYAMKANPSYRILQHISINDGNVDVCSVNELRLAIQSGIPPERISACPFVPSTTELLEYIQSGCYIDLDSLEDIQNWCRFANDRKSIGLRINPNVKAGFHEHCSSGVWDSKFGMPISDIPNALKMLKDNHKTVCGLHIHIGSSSYESKPYLLSIERILCIIQDFNLTPDYINIGGGWGIPFDKQDDRDSSDRFPLSEYAKGISSLLKRFKISTTLELRAEPGEYLIGPCGFLVCTVRRIIERSNGLIKKRIAVVDGGTYLYPGPSLYETDNFIVLLNREEEKVLPQVLAGRSMLAGDKFGIERPMPLLQPGDIIAIGCAGAYSKIKSCNFNLLPKAEEFNI